MQFRGKEYFRAATERMRQARRLFKTGDSYALAMYCGGLAVECILRAFRWEKDKAFEGRHDLQDLLKASALLQINEEEMRRHRVPETAITEYAEVLRTAMNVVVLLWHNNLRFASEDSLKAFLNRLNRPQGIRGDGLKKNAADLLNAAQTVVDRGGALWTSREK
jgi:HEPN domain-containing protein